MYNDPADYAKEGTDKVYPKYIWLPETGVQRGSIYQGRGDPLTPGLPSIDGVIRIPQDKAKLPKIPAVPMPYGDAVHIMKLMQGKTSYCRRFALGDFRSIIHKMIFPDTIIAHWSQFYCKKNDQSIL